MLNIKIVMANSLTDKEKWEIIGIIKVSEIRYITLKTMGNQYMMPKEIAAISGYKSEQISKTLTFLKDKKLVCCVNESLRKGRIYHITKLGSEILAMMDAIKY